MVVLRVADAGDVVRRQLEAFEGGPETGRLVDIAGKDHHRVLVEDDLQFQAEVADRFQDGRLVRPPRRHDDAADRDRHAAPPQLRHEALRRRLGEEGRLLVARPVELGAVLGDDPLEQVQVAEGAPEVVQLPAGDEDELAARRAEPFQGGQGRRVHDAVAGDRAIVIGGQSQVAHRGSPRAIGAAEQTGCRPTSRIESRKHETRKREKDRKGGWLCFFATSLSFLVLSCFVLS